MVEIVIELLIFLVLAAALGLFVRADKSVSSRRAGFLLIKIGFLLILFGAFMDVVEDLNIPGWAMIGDAELQILLEKVVGYLFGSVLLLVGLWYWLPSIRTMDEVQVELDRSRRELEEQFQERTRELKAEVEKRRKVDATLSITEERRRILYENSPVGITHGFVGGKIIERNPAYAHLLGFDSPAEVAEAEARVGDTFRAWVDRADVDRIVEMARTEQYIRGLLVRMRRKDDSLIWVRLDLAMLADEYGQNYYFYAFALDVTDKKEFVDAIARREQRLKDILQALPVGIFVVDIEGRTILDINRAALRMSGYSYDELIGASSLETLCGDSEVYADPLEEGLSCVKESMLVCKGGNLVPVLKTSVRAVIDGHVCLVESVVDISEQKRLEELRVDVDRIVAHDLKAPIISVIDGCRFLLMGEGQVDGEIREILELIEHYGEKALKMIGLSLTLYKIEAGTFEYVPETVDIMSVIHEVRRELGSSFRAKDVTMAVLLHGAEDAGAASLTLPANVSLLESMITNLSLNALEATMRGGEVTISLTAGNPVVMCIKNSGVVPSDIREIFFDKYSTHGKVEGTGLGTYSARLMVLALGGEISMDTSDEENQTTVKVTLPGV